MYAFFSVLKWSKNDIVIYNILNNCWCLLCRAKEHAVDLPAMLLFPSWRTHTCPSTLSLPNTAEELLSRINTALLHPMVIKHFCFGLINSPFF